MLKCNINKAKKRVRVKGEGTPLDLAVESATMIGEIYHHIHEKAPNAAQEYQTALLAMLLAPDSPAWKER